MTKTHDIKVDALTKGGLLVIRVGSDDRPAGPTDILAMKELLQVAGADKLTAVTHHAVDYFMIPEMDENETLVIRIGSELRPAGTADIEKIQKALAEVAAEGGALVTHHAIDYFVLDRRHLDNVVTTA